MDTNATDTRAPYHTTAEIMEGIRIIVPNRKGGESAPAKLAALLKLYGSAEAFRAAVTEADMMLAKGAVNGRAQVTVEGCNVTQSADSFIDGLFANGRAAAKDTRDRAAHLAVAMVTIGE